MVRPPLLFVIVSSLAPLASAGKVRVVAPTGAPYVRVQDAINAAQKGDVILVKSATQDSMRINQKWLAIVGDTGVTIQQSGAVRVTNILPGALVVLSGITAQGVLDANVADLAHGLLVDNSQGQMFAQDCSFRSLFGNQPCLFGSDGANVRNTAGIAFTRCTATSGPQNQVRAVVFDGFGVQGSGLDVLNSTIACFGVTANGGIGGASCGSCCADGAWGGDGVTMAGGTLFASGSFLIGGSGGDSPGIGTTGCQQSTFGGKGGNGVGTGPTVRLLATSCYAGAGGMGCGIGVSFGPGMPVSGPATTISGTQRTLNGSRLIRDNTRATFTFGGAPGETVDIAVSLNTAVHTFDAAQKGVLHVPNPRWRQVGVIPASGTLTKTYKLPDLPLADPGAIWVVQARFTNFGSGAVQLSNPHVLVEVDASY